MRVSINDQGQTIIQGDEHIVAQAAGADMNAETWQYVDLSGNTITVDVRDVQPTLGVLARIFLKAEATKEQAWAAAYVRHRDRILKWSNSGSKYEKEAGV